MTEHYKRELVANQYLFSKARPTTRQLLYLSSTSLELLTRENGEECFLMLVPFLPPSHIYKERHQAMHQELP